MKKIASSDSLLRTVTVDEIEEYVKSIGWQAIPHPNGRLRVFSGPRDDDGEPLRLKLPINTFFDDAYDRIADAINLLSLVGRITPEETVKRIRNVGRDFIFCRVLDSVATNGTISLALAVQEVYYLKNLIAFSASCEGAQAKPYFNQPTKQGNAHAETVQFGHTFRGSFGFTIESPLARPLLTLGGIGEPVPLSRRVIERIARGLNDVRTATESGDMGKLPHEYKRGLNGNMCAAIIGMSKAKSINLEFEIAWSPRVPLSSDVVNFHPVQLTPKEYHYIESAERRLKEHVRRKVTVTGMITDLHYVKKHSLLNDDPHSVIVRGRDETNKQIAVIVLFDRDTYALACDAHRDEKRVRVSGLLKRQGKEWHLVDPHDFQVL